MERNLRRNRRGGMLLDLVIAAGVILLGAFVLSLLGINFAQILEGAGKFFGL
jgi:hypothetical protein